MGIRKANFQDIPAIKRELVEFYKLAPYLARFEYPDDEYVSEFLANFVRGESLLVAETDGGELQGFIAGFRAPLLHNPRAISLTEVLWYVTPAHRGRGVGEKLKDEFKKIGHDVDFIIMGCQGPEGGGDRMLLGDGFALAERSYILPVIKL